MTKMLSQSVTTDSKARTGEGETCTSCGSELDWKDQRPPVFVKGHGYVCDGCATEGVSSPIGLHPVVCSLSKVS